ncbi:lipopolysaccharide biosynthesis protein [Nocardioides campestrisoli]|uniref:lipopolysaccharide biosynthesis protein n=1 Tax=Nocardioides campestrisoli TaxID=2736757 RepID=UPI00163DD857|nr:lipopolysaccharide biosynthesis protein [Nocardioides campestrisoli]
MAEASRRLIGRGSIYTLGSAAPMLAGVAVTPLLTRSLGVEAYGEVSIAVTVMQWALGLFALGLPVAITRYAVLAGPGPEAAARARGVTGAGAALSLALTLVLAGCGWVLGDVLADSLPTAALLALVAGGLGAGVAMCQAWALAHEDSWFYVALAFGVALVAPAAGLLTVAVTDSGAVAYLCGLGATVLVVELLGLARVRRSGRFVVSWPVLRENLRIGLPVVPHQFATGSATGVAVLTAGSVLGRAAGGQAQVAVYLGTVTLIVTSALSYAWTPIILRAPEEERGGQLSETARVVTWIAGLAATGVAATSPLLLRFLVPASFDVESLVPVAALVSLTAPLAAVYLAHSQPVVASGRTAGLALASPSALLLGAGASVIATRAWGLVGVAIGYVVTYVLLYAFTRTLARRVSDLRWHELPVLPALLVALAGCLAGALLPVTGLEAVLSRGLLATVAGVLLGHRVLSTLRPRTRGAGAPEPGAVV